MESLSPNLMVGNVNKTVMFYEEHLGFKLTMSVPDEGEFDWAMVTNGNAVVMFQTQESLASELPRFANIPVGGTFTLYFRVKNVEGYYQRISAGVEIIKPLEQTFYGAMEFTIADCNGYILTFAGAD